MTVYTLDPLTDSRWPRLLEKHADASIFHTQGWLKALQETYGYTPIAYTTSPPEKDLDNGVVFCRVNSWLTGKRMVSLSFSDHCEPLLAAGDENGTLIDIAQTAASHHTGKYTELRPIKPKSIDSFGESDAFTFHRIALDAELDDIYAGLHKTAIKQMIGRAEREELSYEEGTSSELLDKFYALLLLTRRKHQIPPQPKQWFANLLDCLGDNLKVRVASKDGQPVASIITGAFGRTYYYKYGCSDPKHTKLGGTQMLLWRTICEAKEQSALFFDMGRTDTTNTGLMKFKQRWGAEGKALVYYRSPEPKHGPHEHEGWKMKIAKSVFSRLPDSMLVAAGSMLYKHMG